MGISGAGVPWSKSIPIDRQGRLLHCRRRIQTSRRKLQHRCHLFPRRPANAAHPVSASRMASECPTASSNRCPTISSRPSTANKYSPRHLHDPLAPAGTGASPGAPAPDAAQRRNPALLERRRLGDRDQWSLGRLPLPAPPDEFMSRLRSESLVESLPIDEASALQVAKLPGLHNDRLTAFRSLSPSSTA